MIGPADRVMVLLENIQETGIPTPEQVEQAILGDVEVARFDEQFLAHTIQIIKDGGEDALRIFKRMWHTSEMYRIELNRIMHHAARQITELAVQSRQLRERLEALESIHPAEENT